MNIFAVLDTSDAEDEVVQKTVPKKKESTTKSAPATAVKTVPGQKPPAKAQQNKEEVKPLAPTTEGDAKGEKKDDNRGGRPRGKEGHRHGDKHQGVEEGKRPPKREFERRSGTGRGKEVSKGGRGPYGSGNVDQEAQDAEKNPAAVNDTEGNADIVDDSAEPENESSEVVAEEPATRSLDDYLRQREEARASSSVLAASKATRSVNKDSLFAGLTPKVDEDFEDENKPKSNSNKKDQRSSNKAQVLDVAFKFENASENRDRGDRFTGGRGRGGGREYTRGGRGRGENRSRNPRPSRDAPAPLNSVDFPSL